MNMVNICVLFLYSYMYVSQYGHAEGVTFNSDLCHCRSVAGSRNRSKMSLIRHDRNSGQAGASPRFLGLLPPSIVILQTPAPPFFSAHTQHPTPAGPIGNNCRNESESRLQEEEEGDVLSSCHFMLTRCEVK